MSKPVRPSGETHCFRTARCGELGPKIRKAAKAGAEGNAVGSEGMVSLNLHTH